MVEQLFVVLVIQRTTKEKYKSVWPKYYSDICNFLKVYDIFQEFYNIRMGLSYPRVNNIMSEMFVVKRSL